MYNKKYLGILTVLTGVGFMLLFTMFWACSSDTIGPIMVEGDLDDPVFTAVRSDLDDMVDSIIHNIHNPLTNPWGFPIDSSILDDPDNDIWWGPLNPEDSADYGYSDGWHTMYVVHLTASGSEIFYDSMAFLINGRPLPNSFSGIDEIKYRGSYALDNSSANEDVSMGFITRVDINDVDTYVASAGGTGEIITTRSYSQYGSDITEQFDFDITFSDIELTRNYLNDWDHYSRIDGQIQSDLTYTVSTTNGDDTNIMQQDWIIDITLNGNIAEIIATCGNIRWTFDHNL
ncbi:MAG TPA: hypothetical protein ENO22_10160 [candidate division Zixibacteria bacterium]|nr:hypothetical protein [candidate division Zixibacteria bacterium]